MFTGSTNIIENILIRKYPDPDGLNSEFPKQLIKQEITIMYKVYCKVEKVRGGKWEEGREGKEEGGG